MNPTIKTIFLFGILSSLFIALGYLVGGFRVSLGFFLFSLLINLVMYWFSDKLALAMSGAKPLNEQEAPEIFADMRELSQKLSIPMPRVYISNQMQPNAFATGRNPKNSAICLTQGILQVLNRAQLRGVIAHELAHIRSRDVLTATMAAVMASGISYIAQLGFYLGSDEENRSPLASIFMIIFAPIAALLIQTAISRQREFAADELGSTATRAPQDLANALINLENATKQIPMQVNPALASLYISNPITRKDIFQLLSTHPSIEARVQRLMAMQL